MSQEQLRNQVRLHVDRNIKLMEDSLRERGSDLRSITQQRDQIEVGVFPQTIGFDFYILEPVTIVIGQGSNPFTFQIQSTFFIDNGMPTMAKGLWFPLAVKDGGSEKPCELIRVILTERERRYSPSVDLTIGNPPRVLASRLIEVVDFATDPKQNIPRHDVKNMSPSPTPPPTQVQAPSPTPEPAPAPSPTPGPAPVPSPLNDRWPSSSSVPSKAVEPKEPKEPSSSKDSVEENNEPKSQSKKKKSRAERRRERRERRSIRYSRRRHSRNPAPAVTEPPPTDECTGDLWEKMKCSIRGK